MIMDSEEVTECEEIEAIEVKFKAAQRLFEFWLISDYLQTKRNIDDGN
jgi:hypothetical protein